MNILTVRKSARWLLAAARRKADELMTKPRALLKHYGNDGLTIRLMRGRQTEKRIRCGPNTVHAFVTHADGTFSDLGVSYNLLTNIGRDVWSSWIGGFAAAGGSGTPSTAVSGTSITATGTPWTASNLGTPQLGLAGLRVYAAPHTTTNPVVYGNIISNTTSVATIDKWWKSDDTTGTTPTLGDGFIIGAGGVASVRFMALTTDSGAASASDTTLASEITNNGCGRALATYAHTFGQNTLTLQKAFSVTGTITAIVKAGLFTALSSAGADPMIFETVINQSATVGNGDTLTVTWTGTLSG